MVTNLVNGEADEFKTGMDLIWPGDDRATTSGFLCSGWPKPIFSPVTALPNPDLDTRYQGGHSLSCQTIKEVGVQ